VFSTWFHILAQNGPLYSFTRHFVHNSDTTKVHQKRENSTTWHKNSSTMPLGRWMTHRRNHPPPSKSLAGLSPESCAEEKPQWPGWPWRGGSRRFFSDAFKKEDALESDPHRWPSQELSRAVAQKPRCCVVEPAPSALPDKRHRGRAAVDMQPRRRHAHGQTTRTAHIH